MAATSARTSACVRPAGAAGRSRVAARAQPGRRRASDATARFGLHRLTPGRLGLELTTLIALAAVGAFTFVLVGRSIAASPAMPRIDRGRGDLADRLRFEPLTDDREGRDGPRVLAGHRRCSCWPPPLCGAAPGGAGSRRRRSSPASRLDVAAVHIAKAAYDRPGRRARSSTRSSPPIRPATRPTRSRWSRARPCSCGRASAGRCASRSSRSPSCSSRSSRSAASTCARTTSRT